MNKRRLVIIVSAAVFFLALLGVGYSSFAYAVYAYQIDSPAARTVADLIGIPAAKVGSRYVPYTEYLKHLDAERVFLASPAARTAGFPTDPTVTMKTETLDRVIRIALVESMADEKKFVVTPLDVDRAFDEFMKRATSTTPEDFHNYLHDQFNWTEADFKVNVVRPAIMEDGLRAKMAKESNDDLTAFDKELDARLKKDVHLRIKIQ